jgi:hypothetical protein
MSSLKSRIERLEAAAGPAERPLAIVFYDAAGSVDRLLVSKPPGLRRSGECGWMDADPATPLGGLRVVHELRGWMAEVGWDSLHGGCGCGYCRRGEGAGGGRGSC